MRLFFDFPADTAVLEKIGELVADAGRTAGFNDAEISDIQLAVDEACTNTITHGLQEDPNQTFQLVIQWNADEIEVLIHEAGELFDPKDVQDPDLGASLEDRAIGGLGIFFVRELMDEVEYRVSEDGIKTLHMVKRRAHPKP